MPEFTITSMAAAETEQLGQTIGHQLKGGETIELISDLGGGKTTLVRGLVEGAGSSDHVSSPTFTVSKLYKTAELSIHHFDFYRLSEPGLMIHELQEVADDPQAVTIVEWGQDVQKVLPDQRLVISINHLADEGRQIRVNAPMKLAYLLADSPAQDNT